MNNALYIYHRGTRLARIARQLRIPVQYPMQGGVWTTTSKTRTARLRVGVNWGCLRPLPVAKGSPEPLNSRARNAARKIEAFKLFNAHDIPCPQWSTNYDEIIKQAKEKQTIFARKDGMSGGKGIEIIPPTGRDVAVEKFDFFTIRIPHLREFRVHVWGKEILIVQVKFIEPGSKNPIHSYDNGATFSTVSVDKFLSKTQLESLCSLSTKAVSVLGLFFGAVDVIMNPNNEFYVLEVNTAPGIRTDPVEIAYHGALKELIVE